MFTDHLGSVSAIVAANAVVQQRQSFDAYGARREPSNWQSWTLIQQFSFDTSLTRKGFTGHEGVERTGLIHFGGRLYDPRLGRFVQADPLVEDANLVNGLNRYSYVLNNPLSLTDPTGYLTWSEARPAVAIVVAIVMQNYAGAAYTAMGITNGLAQAAITGAVSGAVGGGSRGAVMGAFSAAMFYGIGNHFDNLAGINNSCVADGQYGGAFGTNLTGAQFAQKVALHGMAGGVMNVLGGGRFGHGFVSAAGTQLSSPLIGHIGKSDVSYRAHRIVAAAIVGGSIAEVTGGKFANGALTGAFSRAFNDESELFDEGELFGDPDGKGAEINLVGCNEKDDAVAKSINYPHAVTVVGHGQTADPNLQIWGEKVDSCYRDRRGNVHRKYFDPRALASLVVSHPEFRESEYVHLFICGTANGSNPLGQQIADFTRKPVLASFGPVMGRSDGTTGTIVQFWFTPRETR